MIVVFLPAQREAILKLFGSIAHERHVESLKAFFEKQQTKYGTGTLESATVRELCVSLVDGIQSYLSFGFLWNIVLGSMISFFIISLINSTVQHALVARDEKRIKELTRKQVRGRAQ